MVCPSTIIALAFVSLADHTPRGLSNRYRREEETETKMAKVSTYLNFMGKTEEAFNFYKAAFRSEFAGAFMRMGDVPPGPGMPALTDAEKQLVMHVELPILGGHVIMGTDTLESMGHKLTVGNNVSINLEPDTRAEADRLFKELSEGGKVAMPMMDMFWGSYWGSFEDKFGTRWMINCTEPKK
jgi:PhnB protein